VTEEDRKKQAAVLADIAKHADATIEEWNAQRFTDDVLRPERAKIRASFYIPEKQTKH
jgi:hypothetical protein